LLEAAKNATRMGMKRPKQKQKQSVSSSEVNFEELLNKQKQNNTLKQKVDVIREQASINM